MHKTNCKKKIAQSKLQIGNCAKQISQNKYYRPHCTMQIVESKLQIAQSKLQNAHFKANYKKWCGPSFVLRNIKTNKTWVFSVKLQ